MGLRKSLVHRDVEKRCGLFWAVLSAGHSTTIGCTLISSQVGLSWLERRGTHVKKTANGMPICQWTMLQLISWSAADRLLIDPAPVNVKLCPRLSSQPRLCQAMSSSQPTEITEWLCWPVLHTAKFGTPLTSSAPRSLWLHPAVPSAPCPQQDKKTIAALILTFWCVRVWRY